MLAVFDFSGAVVSEDHQLFINEIPFGEEKIYRLPAELFNLV